MPLCSSGSRSKSRSCRTLPGRIGKMDAVTPTANWQLWRYQQTEALRNDVVKLLAKYTGKSEAAIRRAAFAGRHRSHGAGGRHLLPLRQRAAAF